MPDEGAIIQVDCAPALQTLASEFKLDGSILKKLGIVVDVGRTLNVNKNPIAENCIKEFHKERLRLNTRLITMRSKPDYVEFVLL